MARLDRYYDGRRVSSILLKQREYLVGRDPDCDMVLQDPHASRRHFQLSWAQEGHFVLSDLETPNGTVVNGVKEFRRKLTADATIQVGEELLIFLYGEVHEGTGEEEALPLRVLSSCEAGADDMDSTALLAPALLNRVQARERARQRPHLLVRRGEATSVVPLDNSTTPIGYGAVKVSLGMGKSDGSKILAEIHKEQKGSYRVKSKGLFAKIDVNGNKKKECTLEAGDQIRFGKVVLEFRAGLEEGESDGE